MKLSGINYFEISALLISSLIFTESAADGPEINDSAIDRSTIAKSSIDSPTIDGRLDDEFWLSAQQISEFILTQPLSFSIPARETIVKFGSDEKGLYIAFQNQQSEGESAANTTLRDESIQADYNEVIVDFDGSGVRAFGFKVSRLNAVQDSVWINENRENVDWDGNWQHATYETDTMWSSEIFIPWDVTLMRESDELRNIKIYFSRWHEGLGQRFSSPAIDRQQQIFIGDFSPFQFASTEVSSLDWFPYFTTNQDLQNSQNEIKIGMDVFWKPSSNKQLNISVNPDFGQVESDELVVNFSAIETFFSEKRPFFRENHELFETRGPENLLLIHTPNIGGAPDKGDADASDILGAVRYTQIGERVDYGILTAVEDDQGDIDGRAYSAARMQIRNGESRLGFLTSYVDRPALSRTAATYAVDYESNIGESFRFTGQWFHTRIEQQTVENQSDSGWWMSGQWQPAENAAHELTLFKYGENIDLSDFGFVSRVNRQQLEYQFQYEWSELQGFSHIRDIAMEFGLEVPSNEQNDDLAAQVEFQVELTQESTAQWEWELEYKFAGVDDLFTRGNNLVKFPSAYTTAIDFNSPRNSRYRWSISADTGREGNGSFFYEIGFEPEFQISDQINISLELDYTNSKGWLIYLQGNELGEYARKELSANLNVSAQFGDNHQLRIRWESVALKAKGKEKFSAMGNGQLESKSTSLDDFSLSEFAFQARYRYELGPLSEIYLVYSRGGEIEEDQLNRNLVDLARESIINPDSERFLFKIKWHF